MEYCVAIRTLGTAGEKYQTLLDSLDRQTIRPKRILVYIPDGYDLPKETIGWEEYIRSPKGMITQRSLPFDEIETEYILFCDDDISLEPTSVERLYLGLVNNQGDCISPNTFPVEQLNLIGKFKKAIGGYAFPRRDDGWAFKVMRNSGYTYNAQPRTDVLQTESAAGPCMLIKKSAYEAIHFEDERWLEDFKYPLGEDLLFYYKLHIIGRKVLVHYNSGIVHLDAGTSSKKSSDDGVRKNVASQVALPYRICYQIANSKKEKVFCILSCVVKFTEQALFSTIRSLIKDRKWILWDYLMGLRDGYRYVHSERFQKIPRFDAYK